GLRRADQVASREDDRDRAQLDRCRIGITGGVHAVEDFWCKTELGEGHVYFIDIRSGASQTFGASAESALDEITLGFRIFAALGDAARENGALLHFVGAA